ncbi:AAA family ATPase [Treponema sp.]|uniref:AAA family ATPase n=1 Tax=Treponema sp. TaxID=166 RepID=UPI00298DFDB4|nr:AAA family ATPase [Treponema sp.]
MFSINCLELTVTKNQWKSKEFQDNHRSLYKILLSDKDFEELSENSPVNKQFLFNDFYAKGKRNLTKNPNIQPLPSNFFTDNINVQAIVGMNGSGKSTLMDLMYLVINNFSYMFERGNKRKRTGAVEMYYVPGVYAKLYFSFNNRKFILTCDDDHIALKEQRITKPIFENYLKIVEPDDSTKSKKSVKKKYIEKMDNKEIASLVKNFFYTIISNYSMQSFVDSNYKKQVYRYIDGINVEKDNYPKVFNGTDCNKERYGKEPFIDSWISPIFHKNDGYIRSIVLNPYRDKGTIDLSNEYELSKDRFCSLLIYSTIKKDVFFFKPYKYLAIKTQFNPQKFVAISNSVFGKYFGNTPRLFNLNSIFFYLDKIKAGGDLFTKHVVDKFNLPRPRKQDVSVFWFSILYIELKLIKIVNQYDTYSEYKQIFTITQERITNSGIDRYFAIAITDSKKLDAFLEEIIRDASHITKKIRRIINFLRYQKWLTYEGGSYVFDLDIYRKIRGRKILSPQLIDNYLPPPIFDWQIFLNKEDENGKIVLDQNSNKPLEIPYNQLSSGEIQFIQTVSVHAYHLMNLVSIPNSPNRPKYNHFNLVFDEVEICFHPEMQRQFLKRLIDLLNDLGVNKNNYINIFIITHSPFILSDIPIQRILYLKDGSQDNSERISPFAGNIGEMFYDSFFLENTIGAFAEKKLKQLADLRKNKTDDSEANAIYESIGSAVIKCLLSK